MSHTVYTVISDTGAVLKQTIDVPPPEAIFVVWGHTEPVKSYDGQYLGYWNHTCTRAYLVVREVA